VPYPFNAELKPAWQCISGTADDLSANERSELKDDSKQRAEVLSGPLRNVFDVSLM
jgi:hypothetical protein